MRKLKTLLILMFAATLSLTLFACGGKKKKEEDSLALNNLSGGTIELTDSAGEAGWNARLQKFELSGRDDNGTVKVKGSDCDITGVENIDFGTPDRYVTTFKPRNNNPNGHTAEVIVVITHTWGEADPETGVRICAHDQAKLTPEDEDVVMHYGGFHYGTGDGEMGAVPDINKALPQIYLTAEEAADLGLNAESGKAQVFNDDAGITGKDSSGRIQPFGMDGRANKVVPSITAGDLTPGMSITIEGYARTDAGNNKDEATGPWTVKNGNWNCPSYGIADPYSPLSSTSNVGGLNVGAAVIVRSEGWVLYNGIGDANSVNVLGGLPAFIEGGGAYNSESGATDKSNCASWEKATADILDGQDVTNRPAYTSSEWKNWWVYSEGKDRHSLDSYNGGVIKVEEGHTYVPVRVTWTYRTYGEGANKVGIIVIESEYTAEDTVLRSYIKVPEATRGSYRTIIHGDYSSLIITKSEYIESETVTDMRISEETQTGAKTQYLAGEQIDAASVLKMEIKSEQNTEWHDGGIAVTNDMLYYYKGEGTTYAEAEEAIDTEADWKAVGDRPLSTNMKFFKVVLKRGLRTFPAMVKENLFTIVENNVAGAAGDAYIDGLDSHDPLAKYVRDIGTATDKSAYVKLSVERAIFRKADASKFASGCTADYYYATLRIIGIGDAFTVSEEKNSGTVGSDGTFYYNITEDGNDVLVAIAIKQNMLGEELIISDLQTTPIHIVFGKDSVGFEVTSEATYTPFKLNVGGEVQIKYTGIGEEAYQVFALYYGATNREEIEIGRIRSRDIDDSVAEEPVEIGEGIQIVGYKKSGDDITITYEFSAFDFENWTSIPFIRLTTNETNKVAEDYVEYDFAFEATEDEGTAANHATNRVYFYEKDGTLYFVTLVEPAAAGKDIDRETDVAEKQNCTVSINTGDKNTARACDLSYIYEKGNIVFASTAYNSGAAYGIKDFVLDKAYGDYGLVVITSVDPAALGFTGDYGFQVKGASNYWKYDADAQGDKISYAEVDTTKALEVVKAGDCYTSGIVARQEEGFLSDYAEVGGKHVNENDDEYCDLCGGRISSANSPTGWFGNSVSFGSMADGEIIDITGSYTSNDGENYEGYGITVDITDEMHYVLNANGFFESRVWSDGNTWLNPSVGPYYDVTQFTEEAKALLSQSDLDAFTNGNKDMESSLITPTHPYNTINGYVNADGVALDAAGIGKVKTDGGQYRYTVTYENQTLTIRVRLYQKGEDIGIATPYYDFTAKIKNLTLTNGAVIFNGSTAQATESKPITVVRSSLNRSVIESAAGETVEGHQASGVNIDTNGFDADRNAKLNVSGMATYNDGNSYHLAFAVNFSKDLPARTEGKVVKMDGTEITGAVAKMSGTKKLLVYVPFTVTGSAPDFSEFLIQLINDEGSTLQNNIHVDISECAFSTVKATANTDALTLGATTFTISYEGVLETDTLVIGSDSKALNAISTSESMGGLTVSVSSAYSSGNITLTFQKPAADLSKVIPSYTIVLRRGADQLLASNVITPSIAPTEKDKQIGQDSIWYARAEDKTLYLFAQSSGTSGLKLNVNAGHTTFTTAPELLGAIDLSFSTSDGNVVLKTLGAITANITAVYTPAAQFTVFVIKLDDLGIDTTTEYGFAIETDAAAHADKVYSVNASRDITEETSTFESETKFALQAHTATTDRIEVMCNGGDSAKEDATYYGYVTITGHVFPADGGECETGGCDMTGWKVEDVVVGTEGLGTSGWTNSNADGYDPADTEKNGAIVKGQKAVFQGTIKTATTQLGYLNMQGVRFKIGGLIIRCDGWVDNVSTSPQDPTGDYATNQWHINPQVTVEYDGSASKNWEGAIANCANNGVATITYDWTTDNKITITYFIQGAAHTWKVVYEITSTADGGAFAKDIYEIGLLPEYGYFAGTLTVTGDAEKVPADQCNRPIRNVGEKNPDPTYTDDNVFEGEGYTIGAEGTAGEDTGWTGYTNNPNWIGKLEKGKKIVITGTQKAMATQPFWSSLTFFVWSTEVSTMPTNPTNTDGNDPGICLNHKNGGAGHDETFDIAELESVLEGTPSIQRLDNESDFSALLREVGADCNVTITFDWTRYNKQFSVTMKVEKNEKSVEKTYTFTEQDGAELAAYYNIGIGVDHSYAKLTNIDRSNGTPSGDLPAAEAVTHAHSYTDGLCTVCGAVQPVAQVGGTAVTDKSWTNEQQFNAAIWSMTLNKGGKVVAYGTQEAPVASNWYSLLARVDLADNTKSIVCRSDNFAFYDDHKWTNDPAHTLPDGNKEFGIKTPNGAVSAFDWGKFAGIARHCDWRVEFDWTGDVIIVTMTFTGTADNQYKDSTVYFKYTLEATALDGKTSATIGVGSELAGGAVACYVATNNG